MEYVTLAHSDLKVSRFCMGGCPMGGFGWGDTHESDFLDAIHAALDAGVTFFDTADTYGLGQSELTLAKGLGRHRSEVAIESKFGVRIGNGKTTYDNSPAYIRQALDASLKRLNTDYVDVYTIHYRDTQTPMEQVMDTLYDLRKQGKVRYFGLSNVHGYAGTGGLDELAPYAEDFVNCQDEFSLACRKNEADLRNAQGRLGVTPMTWGSLGQGILTGKYDLQSAQAFGADDRRSRDIYVNFHGEKLQRNLRIVEALRGIAANHGVSIAACAIRWILDILPESVALAGVKDPRQLSSNVEAMGWQLTAEELKMLSEVSK